MLYLDFFRGFKPLSKTFTSSKVEPYPLVKNVTSERVEVTTLQEYHQALVQFGGLGYALLKGNFSEQLIKESKANKVDRDAYSRTLILDIDGLDLDCDLLGEWDAQRVAKTAAEVLKLFPDEFQKTKHIACASSSAGIKNNVRLHIHFILDELYSADQLKALLKALNIAIPPIRQSLSLTSTGKALKFIIDPCLADNTRTVFIAPPSFIDIMNPFADDRQRFVLVDDKPLSYLKLDKIIENLPNPVKLVSDLERTLRDIHRKRGSVYSKAQTKVKRVDGITHRVITNPDSQEMVYSYCNDHFAYYNIGRGDSNAYYVPLDKPEIVFNFKGEENFLFKVMDENAYNVHKTRFGEYIIEAEKSKGVAIPRIFMDGDDFLCTLYNPITKEIERTEKVNKQKSAENLVANFGGDMPEIIPLGKKTFNPRSNEPYKENTLTLTTEINTFKPTPLMKQDMIYPVDIHYDMMPNQDGEQRLPAPVFYGCCPTIMKIIDHMLGNDQQCVNHFINWLAFIWQNREKPETTWLAQGTQGTGKGLFFRRVIRPLFGDYAQERMLNNIEDAFSGWAEEVLFLMLDEVNINNSRANSGLKETLKHWISEPQITVRAMRQEQRQVESYFAIMMLSNEHGAVTIEAGDRRYNVAPRQEIKIERKFPQVNDEREKFDSDCDAELVPLVMLLDSVKVNEAAVRRCLDNQAKHEVSEAAMSIAERFCNAIKNGELEYLTHVLFISETNHENALRLNKARTIVEKMIGDANKEEVMVKQEDLRHVFAAFEQKDISPNRFGRICTKFGVQQTRKRAGMFIPVEWRLDEEDLNVLLTVMTPASAAKIPNIVPPRGH